VKHHMHCRHCSQKVTNVLVDLATAPPSNAYLTAEELNGAERYYPLRVLICENCWLAQTQDFANASELFSADYAYFSSISKSWLDHSEDYVSKMVERFGLDTSSLVVEIAANDGYLLQFVQARGIPCYGVEPTRSTANAARAKGIDIVEEFFGVELAHRLSADDDLADLIIANNVLAHVPDINDFVKGIADLLKAGGTATFEFPHLLKLIEESQFDTIYHEHFSYISLTAVSQIFEANGLLVFDVEELPTHGGSLRIYAQRSDSKPFAVSTSVASLLSLEQRAGMTNLQYYSGFQDRADAIKNGLVKFLIEAQASGKRVVAYGAAAKGNTLLNYAGVRANQIPYVIDANLNKQGMYLPGSRIPIVDETRLREDRPDYVLILPWNLAPELAEQLGYIRDWGGKFVRAVPELTVWAP